MSAALSGTTGTTEDRAPIRVWRADLDRPEPETTALLALLSIDEQSRAERFRFTRDQRRFIVGRALLRVLLGRCLGVAPEALVFAYGMRGKPRLERPPGSDLEFNLSHANGVTLIATAWGRAIGVDLEWERRDLDYLGIAARFFTPAERAQIEAPPDEAARRAAFFRGWARKEAFLKARGDGLWIGLDQFEVTIDPTIPPRVVRTAWDPGEARRWSLLDLAAAPGFAAALVVAGSVAGPIVVESLP